MDLAIFPPPKKDLYLMKKVTDKIIRQVKTWESTYGHSMTGENSRKPIKKIKREIWGKDRNIKFMKKPVKVQSKNCMANNKTPLHSPPPSY